MADGMKLSELSADGIEEIIRDNYADIYKYCFWRIKHHSDAEDITQETFLRFIDNLPNYSDRGKPKALLYTIARNLCINWHNQIKPLFLSDKVMDYLQFSAETDTEAEMVNRLTLHKYISELPNEQQEILMLRYNQELQINEIAQVLGMSRFAIMYRLRLAMKTLRRRMRKEVSGYEE